MLKKRFDAHDDLLNICVALGCPQSIIDHELKERRRDEGLKLNNHLNTTSKVNKVKEVDYYGSYINHYSNV